MPFDLLPGKGILWKERDTMHPAKEIHMVKRHLRLLVVTVACIALLGGCASKYGAQTTQVNYYPQCYSPVAQLRAEAGGLKLLMVRNSSPPRSSDCSALRTWPGPSNWSSSSNHTAPI